MGVIEILKKAISKKEFKDFLKGTKEYNIRDRDGFFTDKSAVLYLGIYKYYELNPKSKINLLFENTLIEMLNGDEFDVVTAFDYFWKQALSESNNNSPFQLSKNSYIELKNSIIKNSEKLKKYKELPEYGALLEDGAYEYIENMTNYFETEYGRKIL